MGTSKAPIHVGEKLRLLKGRTLEQHTRAERDALGELADERAQDTRLRRQVRAATDWTRESLRSFDAWRPRQDPNESTTLRSICKQRFEHFNPHFRFEGCTRTFRCYPSSVFVQV
jgi:hypothetical protein